MEVVIVKYNAGNTQSVLYALERLGISATVSDEAEILRKADRVIFPGVGEASSAMNYLKKRKLDKVLCELKQPFLGICLGMQLMCAHSEENDTKGLGIFQEKVRLFPKVEDEKGNKIKIPHMGWNSLKKLQSPLFEGIRAGSFVYFVHSYYVEKSSHTTALCEYGLGFSAALQQDNFYAVQFHPEKSAELGSKILSNFIENCHIS